MMQVKEEVAIKVMAIIAWYVAISFVLWEFNPSNWGEGWRAALIGCAGYIALCRLAWKDMVKK